MAHVFGCGGTFTLHKHLRTQAISYGRVLKTEKLTRNCVLYVKTRILDRKSDRIRLSLLRILAVFWGEVSRPIFLFFRGVVRGFYDVVIFRQKNQQGIFRYMSTFQPKKWLLSQICRVRNWIPGRGNWSVSTIFQNAILKKRQTALHASRKMTGGTSRKAGPIRPLPCSNTPAKVLKARFPETTTGLP